MIIIKINQYNAWFLNKLKIYKIYLTNYNKYFIKMRNKWCIVFSIWILIWQTIKLNYFVKNLKVKKKTKKLPYLYNLNN